MSVKGGWISSNFCGELWDVKVLRAVGLCPGSSFNSFCRVPHRLFEYRTYWLWEHGSKKGRVESKGKEREKNWKEGLFTAWMLCLTRFSRVLCVLDFLVPFYEAVVAGFLELGL